MIDLITRNSYLISDHHFGHAKISLFEPSRDTRAKELGYKSFEEMIIDKHNAIVKDDDIVVLLGDFSWNSPQAWASRLKGRKILILGNHDRKGSQCYNDFEYVVRGVEILHNGILLKHTSDDELMSACIINIDNYVIGLCHYPIGDNNVHDVGHSIRGPRIDQIAKIFDSFSLDYVIHGHLHSQGYTDPKFNAEPINVSCEVVDYTPVKIKDLIGSF